MMTLPLWTAAAAVAALIVLAVFAYQRAGTDALLHALTPVALVFVGATATWLALGQASRQDLESERRAIDARVVDLLARATMPGSALACLDAIAGETVEASCEKAVFSTPETTAGAVSYVSAQISLLVDLSEHVQKLGGREPAAFGSLRRSVEGDRFGIVAHVLSFRDGCTATACPLFASLKDTGRLVANLNESAYDRYVSRYAPKWPAVSKDPVVSSSDESEPEADAAPDTAKPAKAGVASTLEFPSADSIPPVSIMNAEPAVSGPPGTTGATPKQAAPKRSTPSGGAPQHRPAAQQPQPKATAPAPIDLNPNAPSAAAP